MNEREAGIRRKFREREFEKQYRQKFQEYEEWRQAQASEKTESQPTEPQEKKKAGLTRWDLLFVGLGFLTAVLWRGCSAK